MLLFVFSFVLFGVNFLSSQLFAQSIPPIHITHYTTDDGLPHDVGYQILEDKQGYLWIGTDNGLARFDGDKFKTYGDPEGLTNAFAIDMTVTSNQEFYIGTWGNGIYKKINDSIRHVPLDLSYQKITRVNSSDPDFLNILTKNGFNEMGYYTFNQKRYNIKNEKIQRVFFFQEGGNYYKSVEEKVNQTDPFQINSNIIQDTEKKENIWLVSPNSSIIDEKEIYFTSQGPFKTGKKLPLVKSDISYNESSDERWLSKETNVLEPLDPRLVGIPFASLVEDQKGGFWLGAKGKIYHLGADGEIKIIPCPSSTQFPLEIIRWQERYLVFFNYEDRSKLYLFNIETEEIHEISDQYEFSTTISDIYVDKEDNLWITTDGSGLYCTKPFQGQNYSKTDGLENTYIYDILEAKDGTIYAATKSGIYFFKNEKWFKLNEPLAEGNIRSGLEKDGNGHLLFGGGLKLKNLVQIKTPSQKIKQLDHNQIGRNFYVDDKNRIWGIEVLNYCYQLYKKGDLKTLTDFYKNQNWKKGFSEDFLTNFFEIQKINHDHFVALSTDKATVLIGTSKGLFEVKGDSLKHYSKEDGLPSNVIHDIGKKADGTIWIATEKGVCIKDGNQFLNLSTEGLLSFKTRKLLFDHKDKLWVGTPSGLHYFILSEATWIPITKHLGLIANDVTSLFEDSQKRLWIGTSKGITMLPNQESPKRLPPPSVTIEKMYVNNQPFPITEKIKKVPFRSTLRLEYTALSFQSTKELLFQYRLNLNDDWQSTKSRSIALFDLADGTYNFQIKAKKPSSDWSTPKTFRFNVKPPWYRSLWFLGLMTFALLILGQLLFLYRIRSEREKIEVEVQLKEEMAQLEMKALQAQMNPHFIFNAMNSIMDFVMNEDKYSANRYLAKFSKLMRLFLDASKSNYNSLGEELELITLYVELEKLRFKEKFDFEISYDEDLPVDILEIPSILIQPFIENAIHHGLHLKKGKGKLKMHISLNDPQLIIEIMDNGVGRKAALEAKRKSLKTYKSRGTQIVQEKIALLNTRQDDHYSVNTIDLVDYAGQPSGTKVVIKISILD